MNYRITHRTLYEYAAPVTVSQHVTRLEPRVTPTQSCEQFSLTVFPEPVLRKTRPDYFGNRLCFFSIQEIHHRLEITTHSRVAVTAGKLPPPETTPAWEEVVSLFRDPVSPEVVEPYQFVFDSPQVRASFELADYALASFARETPLLLGAADLTRRIFTDFKFDPQGHHRGHAVGGGLAKAARRLPGFRASGHRVPAFARIGRALRQRLSAHAAAGGPAAPHRRRRQPRVVPRLLSRRRLGGF